MVRHLRTNDVHFLFEHCFFHQIILVMNVLDIHNKLATSHLAWFQVCPAVASIERAATFTRRACGSTPRVCCS